MAEVGSGVAEENPISEPVEEAGMVGDLVVAGKAMAQ